MYRVRTSPSHSGQPRGSHRDCETERFRRARHGLGSSRSSTQEPLSSLHCCEKQRWPDWRQQRVIQERVRGQDQGRERSLHSTLPSWGLRRFQPCGHIGRPRPSVQFLESKKLYSVLEQPAYPRCLRPLSLLRRRKAVAACSTRPAIRGPHALSRDHAPTGRDETRTPR
jgi:hypothetical protein